MIEINTETMVYQLWSGAARVSWVSGYALHLRMRKVARTGGSDYDTTRSIGMVRWDRGSARWSSGTWQPQPRFGHSGYSRRCEVATRDDGCG